MTRSTKAAEGINVLPVVVCLIVGLIVTAVTLKPLERRAAARGESRWRDQRCKDAPGIEK